MAKLTILYPYMMYAEYEDGFCGYFGGDDEEYCTQSICDAQEKHGLCECYTSVTNDHYFDGELREDTL